MSSDRLKGRRILVVEDDYLLVMDLCDALQSIGAVVVGPVPSVDKALWLIEHDAIDAALLDVNLGGEMAYPVADSLVSRRIPFVFTTGYEESALNQRYPGVQRCDKPTEFRLIAQALETAIAA